MLCQKFSVFLKSKRNFWIVSLLFFCCVLAAFFVRTYHYNLAVYDLNAVIQDIPVKDRDPEPGFFRRFLPLPHQNFSPFTIESAMMYSYAQDIALGKGVPAEDPSLCAIEDIPPYAQMNMALEWFLGWGWRLKNAIVPDPPPTKRQALFQDHPHMAFWMSTQLRFWASLTSGFVFLWLIVLGCPKPLALFGGLLHAVALAAVARSTGQDFVRGEFCIPLIMASMTLAYSLYRKKSIIQYILLFICSFLAFVSWDLCQMLFGIWTCCELLRFILGKPMTAERRNVWIVITLAIWLNALFVPFNVTYELIRSSLVCVQLPTLAAAYVYDALYRRRHRPLWRSANGDTALMLPWKKFQKIPRWVPRLMLGLLLPLALYGIWSVSINTPEYASNYSHFSEAMKAKFEFYNVKPKDPSKLSYDARILWTPSMHSATWDILISFFPSLFFGRQLKFSLFHFVFGYLPVTMTFCLILGLCVTLFKMFRSNFIRHWQTHMIPFLYTIGFTASFVYIVRYHEFVILFMAVSLPLLIHCIWQACALQPEKINPAEAYTRLYDSRTFRNIIRSFLIVGCIFCLCWESYASLGVARRKYTGDVAMQDTARLIVWFRAAGEKVQDQGVAANITIGPMLHAYAGTGVVMNPQFGLKRIRDATQEYLETLYHGTEEDLARYCENRKAKYLVYNRGALHDMSIYSNRYIANAKNIASTAPANLMYFHADRMEWFYELEPPRGLQQLSKTYTVFRVVTPKDRAEAEKLLKEAWTELRKQHLENARKLAEQCIELDPISEEANKLYYRIFGYHPLISIRGLERK